MLTREWVCIFGVVGLFLSLIGIAQLSKIKSDRSLQTHIAAADRLISITLTGAVERPGTYQVRPGSSLKELLEKVPLSGEAQRKKVPFKKIFYAPQRLHIPPKKEAARES